MIIVTNGMLPDVTTRKQGFMVCLLIIDECLTTYDNRGPVLEVIFGSDNQEEVKTLRSMFDWSVCVLPNYQDVATFLHTRGNSFLCGLQQQLTGITDD
jgi:replicative superfamily II helicase